MNNHITPTSLLYVVSYGILIFAFTFFYVYVAFDPHQQADIIRKQGGYIPGIRPGPPTERYLARILNRITVPGGLVPGHGGSTRHRCSMALGTSGLSRSTGRRC